MKIEEEIGSLLIAQGLTLVTAESCTAGLLAHRITNVPGSSAYYLGGFVTYANEVKEDHLGVRHETLLTHGAVSEQTAREMARGARQRMGSDVAISVTGIAGPDGGTIEKPVGLVYVALSAEDTERCERHTRPRGLESQGEHQGTGDPILAGDLGVRLANKESSAEAALRLLLAYLREREA
jgi:PncC family amidohydrolase